MTNSESISAPARRERRFDKGWFCRLVWIVWLAPLCWTIVILHCYGLIPFGIFGPPMVAGSDWIIRWSAAPLWFVLLFVSAYYLHLILRRFRLSLSAFVVLLLIWGNATIAAFVFRDWETGVMTLLGVGALLGFAFTWSQSAGAFLEVKSRLKSAGLFVLAFLFPIAIPTLLIALALAWLNRLPNDPLIWCVAIAGGGVSSAVIAAFWLIHGRVRRAARSFLKSTVAQSDKLSTVQ